MRLHSCEKNFNAAVSIYGGKESTAPSVKNMHKKQIRKYHVLKAHCKKLLFSKKSVKDKLY